MKAEIIKSLTTDFESQAYEHEGVECWDARSLQSLLGYSRWENFVKVIGKAKTACQTSGSEIEDHFRDITKMVETGSEAKRLGKKSGSRQSTGSQTQGSHDAA